MLKPLLLNIQRSSHARVPHKMIEAFLYCRMAPSFHVAIVLDLSQKETDSLKFDKGKYNVQLSLYCSALCTSFLTEADQRHIIFSAVDWKSSRSGHSLIM